MAFGLDFKKADKKAEKSREILQATLSRKSKTDKAKVLKNPDMQHWLSLLTPTQYSELFPGYYKKPLPDIGKAVLGGAARYSGMNNAVQAIPAGSKYSMPPQFAGGGSVRDKSPAPEDALKKALRDSGINMSENTTSSSLAEMRSKFTKALKENKDSLDGLLAMTLAEVGSQGKTAKTRFIETAFNRALAMGKETVDEIINNAKYYEPHKNGSFKKYYDMIKSGKLDEATKKKIEDVKKSLEEVAAGSNITRGNMHNASAGVADQVKQGGYDADTSTVQSTAEPGKSPETTYTKRFKHEQAAMKSINEAYDADIKKSAEEIKDGDRPWTSLEKPPSKAEVDAAMRSGVKHFDFDPSQPGAKEASEYIASKGAMAVAYSQGGGSKEWGEKEIDLTSDKGKEFIKSEVEKIMKSGDYGAIHIDNIDRVKNSKQLYDIVKQVEDESGGKLSVIPKNNVRPFAEMYEKYGKDLKKPAPYALLENVDKGMDKGDVEKFTSVFPGKAYGIEFAKAKEPGQSTTLEQADKLAGKHGLAGVYHMKSEEKKGENTGFESRGAKFIQGGKVDAPAGVNENFLKFWNRLGSTQKRDISKQLGKIDVDKLNSMADQAYKTQKDAVLYEPDSKSGVKFDVRGGNIEGLDPKLLNLMQESSKDLPEGWKVSMISGKDARSTGTQNHPGGIAMDVQIYDDKGKLIPQNRNSAGWKHYEQLYRSVVIRGKELYPDEKFIWGGAWQSKAAGNGDPQHYQIVNKKVPFSSTTSGGYSFESGLDPSHDFARSTPENQLSKEEREAWDKRVRENITKEKMESAAKNRAKEEQTGSTKTTPLVNPAAPSVTTGPSPAEQRATPLSSGPAAGSIIPKPAAAPQQSQAPQQQTAPQSRPQPQPAPIPNTLKPESSTQHAPLTPSASRAVEDSKVSETSRQGDGAKAI